MLLGGLTHNVTFTGKERMRSPANTGAAAYSASASPASDLGSDRGPASFEVSEAARASSWAAHASAGAKPASRATAPADLVATTAPAVAEATTSAAVDVAPADTAAEQRRAKMMAMLQAARDGLNL